MKQTISQQVKELKIFAISKKWKTLIDHFDKGEEPSTIESITFHGEGIKVIPKFFKCFTFLKKLNLCSNKITKIENLEIFVLLQQLELGNNCITKIEGLQTLFSLTKLYLWENKIIKLQIISNIPTIKFWSLQSLNLAKNLIVTIEGIIHIQMPNLTLLCLQQNNISNFRALRRAELSKILNLKIYKNKTEQLTIFHELNSQKLKNFHFGQFEQYYAKRIEDQTTKKSAIFIFKMKSMSLEFVKEKQKVWKQHQTQYKLKFPIIS